MLDYVRLSSCETGFLETGTRARKGETLEGPGRGVRGVSITFRRNFYG